MDVWPFLRVDVPLQGLALDGLGVHAGLRNTGLRARARTTGTAPYLPPAISLEPSAARRHANMSCHGSTFFCSEAVGSLGLNTGQPLYLSWQRGTCQIPA